MSVDDRLREAFSGSDAPTWQPDRAAALRAVRARRRRDVRVRRSGAAALGLAAALVAALVAGPGDVDSARESDPSVAQTGDASSLERLEGVWRTDVVTASDVRDTLGASGHADWADRLLSRIPTPFRLVWTVEGTHGQMRVVGREQFVVDDEVVAVTGDRLVLTPRYDVGESVHRIVSEGSQLRLDFVSTSEASTGGVPGEVWQRVLYDAFDFTRRR